MKRIIIFLILIATVYLIIGECIEYFSITQIVNKLKSLNYQLIFSGPINELLAVAAISLISVILLFSLIKLLFKKSKSKSIKTRSITTYLSTTALGEIYKFDFKTMKERLLNLDYVRMNSGKMELTALGLEMGGIIKLKNGSEYIAWPITLQILNDVNLSDFPAEYTTRDGHKVRSKSEVMIDDFLHNNNIKHVYERRLPIAQNVYCDFYLPDYNVYIEFWGIENNESYERRKIYKQLIYSQNGYKLIELDDSHVKNLNDLLPRKLRKFGIKCI